MKEVSIHSTYDILLRSPYTSPYTRFSLKLVVQRLYSPPGGRKINAFFLNEYQVAVAKEESEGKVPSKAKRDQLNRITIGNL